MFDQNLSDTKTVKVCESFRSISTVSIPDSYDWRKENVKCNKKIKLMPHQCNSAYVTATLSTVQDHICGQVKHESVSLSAQEILDCPKASRGCKGGSVNSVFAWGKRKGFLPEVCYPTKHIQKESICPKDHLYENPCRFENNQNFYKVTDYCMSTGAENIQKEILKNGPVVGQMDIRTDFLVYKEGVYHRTEDSHKFKGLHIVKILGWEKSAEKGHDYWIIQNVWGPTWGENGYAKVSMGETKLDEFAIGHTVFPMPMYDFHRQTTKVRAAE